MAIQSSHILIPSIMTWSSLPPLLVLLYLVILLSIVNGHLSFDVLLSLSFVTFVLLQC